MKPGDRVGAFTIGQKLGRGGTGTVFEATGEGPGRFAVKLLAMGDEKGSNANDRFERERLLLARVAHPNVVKLVDAGVAGDACWLAMPRVEGETLRARLSRGALTASELARAGRELVSALGAIHAAGILHRDLTPSNLMLENGRLIVLDFGLAKLVGDATVTRSRGIRLSLAYAPPERFRGEPQEVASDLYQAGLVLFEMATGRPAFPADDPSKLATAHLMAPAPSARQVNGNLPPLFDRVIERCLRKRPRERYASASALEDDFSFLFPA
jgi:serine/threonine protein kinase